MTRQTGREIWIIRSLAPNWRSESVTSRLPPVSLSVPRTRWRRSCVDRHPESWWRLCGAGGGGPAVPRSAGRLLLPGGGCLRVSRPQLCRCLNGGWRCRVATSSSRTHRKLTLRVQTVLLFSAVSPAEVYISTLQLFGLFSSMIFPAVEAREGDRLLVYDGEPSVDFHQPQRSTSTASGVLRLPAEYFDCRRSTSVCQRSTSVCQRSIWDF